MSIRAVAALLCLVSLAASAQRAGALEGKKIAVLEFTVAEGAKVQSRELLSDDCRGAVAAVARPEGALVITRENMLEVLKATGGKCVEGECEVETARNLGVDLFVTGSITSVDGELFLSLKAYETRKGELLGQRRISGAKEKALLELVRPTTVELVREAFGLAGAKPSSAQVQPTVQLGSFAETGRDVVAEEGEVVIAKFESAPAGAAVRLDGELLCKATPCSKRVAVGRHEVAFEQERYSAATVAAVIGKGAIVRATLKPKFGWLTIETEVPGISVTLDGVEAGKTPVNAREVDEGVVEVAVSDGCYVRTGERIAVKAGERRTLRLAATPRIAGLKVNVADENENDLDAVVQVDGREVGQAGVTLKVPACSRELTVRAGERAWRAELQLEEGKVTALTLKPAAGGTSPQQRAGRETPKAPVADDDFDSIFGTAPKKSVTATATAAPDDRGVKKSVYVPPPPPASSEPEKLSQSDIMAVVLANKASIKQCADEQKAKEPGSRGKVVMKWTIQTSGKVGTVNCETDKFRDSYMASCLSKLIKGFQFPRHRVQGEPVGFTFTI